MQPITSIKVKEVGTDNYYIVQLEKASRHSGNTIGFDHKFNIDDLNRLKKIGDGLGLKVKIENNMIEFTDYVKIEILDNFDLIHFMPEATPYDYYTEFCNLLQTKFELC